MSYNDCVTVAIFCHYNTSVMNRLVKVAQDKGMTDGEYAFFTFTDYPSDYTTEPWAEIDVDSIEELESRQKAFYAVKQVILRYVF